MSELTAEAAREFLLVQDKARVAACQTEIQRVLKQYGCALIPEAFLTEDGRIGARLSLRSVNKPLERNDGLG
jgi:hypothetical protein